MLYSSTLVLFVPNQPRLFWRTLWTTANEVAIPKVVKSKKLQDFELIYIFISVRNYLMNLILIIYIT